MIVDYRGRNEHETLLDWMRRMEGGPPPTPLELRRRRREAVIAYTLRGLATLAVVAFVALAIALAYARPGSFLAGFCPALFMSLLAGARAR